MDAARCRGEAEVRIRFPAPETKKTGTAARPGSQRYSYSLPGVLSAAKQFRNSLEPHDIIERDVQHEKEQYQ